jgi:hypothetical protein
LQTGSLQGKFSAFSNEMAKNGVIAPAEAREWGKLKGSGAMQLRFFLIFEREKGTALLCRKP